MAAGLGFKDFQTGEVLTAGDVDGYLMQGIWVFASAAARDAAVTSPQEGNFAYLKDTNTTTYYTGSAWTNLDTTGMVNPMTTTGDTIYSSSGSTPARLGIGSTGQVLTVAGGVPSWATPAGGAFVGVSVTRTAHKNIASGTTTTIDFNSEFYDTDGFHDNTTNNDRLTVPSGKAGKYLVVFQTQWQANEANQYTIKYVYILKNGDNVARTQLRGTDSGPQQTYQTTAIVNLAVGDYINTTVYNDNSGTASDLYFSTATPYYSYLSMAYLGA